MQSLRAYSNRLSIVCAVLVFTVLTFLLYQAVPDPNKHLEIDSTGYERIAVHIAQTSRIECPVTPNQHPTQTFAYPVFLGLIYKMFGHDYAWVVLFQYLLALFCAFFIYQIALTLFNVTVARYALLLWSVNLGFLVYVQFLLTEILFITLLLAFLYSFVRYLKKYKIQDIALAGFLLGCSVVVKPAALFFVFPLLLFLIVSHKKSKRNLIFALTMCASMFYLPVTAYMLRNKICYGSFRIAPMMDEILYKYFAARVQAKIEQRSHEDILKETETFKGQHSFDDQGWKDAQNRFFRMIYEHPLALISVCIESVSKTFLGLFTTQLKVLLELDLVGGQCSFFKTTGSLLQRAYAYITCGSQSPTLRAIGFIEALYTIIRYLLILIACYALLRRKEYMLLLFFFMYIGYFTAITCHDGCARYRMMIEPLLIIWTAFGLWYCIKSK